MGIATREDAFEQVREDELQHPTVSRSGKGSGMSFRVRKQWIAFLKPCLSPLLPKPLTNPRASSFRGPANAVSAPLLAE
ncbi:hypothetical protein E2562_024819 [Oryza meyeriana var. granulata]|uniref:Uncharacterized protein n=1 Tax=Oryza meyeriana var. granulata TaxID=110450 RepID=A0A6G1FC21_9ORYZ|nr:hypothetical protein E2562_024819 [Oryza meyeriana var. granulata]